MYVLFVVMFDNERYDHTYCRLTKDGEEIPTTNRKRSYSSASWDMSDTDVDVPSIRDIVVENDGTNKREPVIIVRTKKPRKSAITTTAFSSKPISAKSVAIVKPDKPSGTVSEATKIVTLQTPERSVDVASATVTTAKISSRPTPNSLIKKDNLVKQIETAAKRVVVNGKERSKAKVPNDSKVLKDPNKPKTKRQYNKRKISNDSKSDKTPLTSTQTEERVISVSQSGRVRKLTDKAASLQKKKRTRKPKPSSPATTSADNLTYAVPSPDNSTEPVIAEKAVVNDENDKPVENIDIKNGKNNVAKQGKKSQKKPGRPRSEKTKEKKAPAKFKSKETAGKATKKKVTTKKSTKLPTSKVKQKLIVVSKPSPKQRRAAAAAAAAQASGKSVPAAKIDLNNIVHGSRRRRE